MVFWRWLLQNLQEPNVDSQSLSNGDADSDGIGLHQDTKNMTYSYWDSNRISPPIGQPVERFVGK